MIRFFRKIRFNLLEQNKTGKYLKYAIGEIVLVVIGILIAISINNWNEARKTRDKEVTYLNNIKSDLQISILEINEFISERKSQINFANTIMEHFNGKPVADWNIFNKSILEVYTWQRFFLRDNTFQELINSGNYAIISNDSIKNELLNLELLYKKLKDNENHFRYDAEVTLYEPGFETHDINSMSKNYAFQVSNGIIGELGNITKETYGNIFEDRKQKNGFALAVLEFSGMKEKMIKMKEKCDRLISLIDIELAK